MEENTPKWLNLIEEGTTLTTSAQLGFPVKGAFSEGGSGWKAAQRGEQSMRFLFDAPHSIRRIRLTFREDHHARTQEFVLRWLSDTHRTFHDVVRQQYTFSPPGTVEEIEEYDVVLDGVRALELVIVPDISGGKALASLSEIRVA